MLINRDSVSINRVFKSILNPLFNQNQRNRLPREKVNSHCSYFRCEIFTV